VAKKSFSLIEIIFSISLISLTISQLIPKNNFSKIDLVTDKLLIYLKYTRYTAMIDNRYNINDNMWFRERWTLKFQNCSKTIGGLYYVIYSDKNHGGGINKNECLKDPLTNKYLYSNNDCVASQNESKYILLTKEFGITNINVSCNSTSTIGQITFDHNGSVYSRISTNSKKNNQYKLDKKCYIDIYNINNEKRTIVIEANTGYIYKIKGLN
jgi:hypothetical protein